MVYRGLLLTKLVPASFVFAKMIYSFQAHGLPWFTIVMDTRTDDAMNGCVLGNDGFWLYLYCT